MSVRNFFLSMVSVCVLLFAGCTDVLPPLNANPGRITLMTWNTQTFFDAIDDGTEFSEFRGAKTTWNAEKYGKRLDNLVAAVLLCGNVSGMGPERGPDIVVLEEIENERVLRDIVNRLPNAGKYGYAAFVPPDKGSAFGTAVLSRYRVESLSAHAIPETTAPLRPLLEVRLRTANSALVIFAVHWKSKSGETDGSGIRLQQEALLASRIRALESGDPGVPFVACGDFNQKKDEFTLLGKLDNCWDGWFARCADGRENGPAGSYFYNNNWETIDNIFCSPSLHDGKDLEFSAFSVVAKSPLVTAENIPDRYTLYSGKGYSDHLPLVLVLEKK